MVFRRKCTVFFHRSIEGGILKLAHTTAIITGASQGLGYAIAEAFADAGANVVITARSLDGIAKASQSLASRSRPGRIVHHAADVTDESAMKRVVESAIAEFGRIDTLVNNAGVYGPIGPLEETDLAEWKYAFDVNFYGTLIPCRLLLDHFKKNRAGRIINLSGGGATKGMPSFSCYAAAKAAVVRLTETLALEAGEFGITVNAVAPGALNTRLLDEVLQAGPEKTGRQFFEASIKQRDSGGSSLQNAAELCVFLAGQEARSINGRLISAVWDDWKNLPARAELLAKSDVYMLRRITAKERGFDWDDSK